MTRKEMDILLWKCKWLLELGTGNSCKLHTNNVPVIWKKKNIYVNRIQILTSENAIQFTALKHANMWQSLYGDPLPSENSGKYFSIIVKNNSGSLALAAIAYFSTKSLFFWITDHSLLM